MFNFPTWSLITWQKLWWKCFSCTTWIIIEIISTTSWSHRTTSWIWIILKRRSSLINLNLSHLLILLLSMLMQMMIDCSSNTMLIIIACTYSRHSLGTISGSWLWHFHKKISAFMFEFFNIIIVSLTIFFFTDQNIFLTCHKQLS